MPASKRNNTQQYAACGRRCAPRYADTRPMTLILELELWSTPGKQLDAELGNDLAVEIPRAAGLPQGIILGLSFVPCDADVENLNIALNEGELLEDDFMSFCRFAKLPPRRRVAVSAARFLEFVYGRPLNWVHLPVSDAGKSYFARISSWAQENGYYLQPELASYCLLPNIEPETVFSADLHNQ